METPPVFASLPEGLVASLGSVGELLLVLVGAWLFGRMVRKGLTRSGLQAPTDARPGLDWAHIAGLVASALLFVLLLPALVDGGAAVTVRAATASIAEAFYPLIGSLVALAVGDHQRRLLLARADKARGSERDALEKKSESLKLASLVVAGLALVSPGIWAAWPLGVALVILVGLRDDRLRPLLDRVTSDASAGHTLRKKHGLREGSVLELDDGAGVLGGPVGVVDTRVVFGEMTALMRNVDILNQLRSVDSRALETSTPADL